MDRTIRGSPKRKKKRSFRQCHLLRHGWLDKNVVLDRIEQNDILVYKAPVSFIIECNIYKTAYFILEEADNSAHNIVRCLFVLGKTV